MRNFVHDKFNVHNHIDFSDYISYICDLQEIGVTEIEHAASNIKTPKQKERLRQAVDTIHNQGLVAVLYMGVFGTVDLISRPDMALFAQRDMKGTILSYNNRGLRNAMMDPASPYLVDELFPYLQDLLSTVSFDKLFIDIPWMMPKALSSESPELTNQVIVRSALEKTMLFLRTINPDLEIGVNASAPIVNNNQSSGGHVSNLANLFDEYVTEWNPYRWSQPASIVTSIIQEAQKFTLGTFYHATTMTDRKGKMYSSLHYEQLFSSILNAGATPRLGIRFPKEQLVIVGEAYKKVK